MTDTQTAYDVLADAQIGDVRWVRVDDQSDGAPGEPMEAKVYRREAQPNGAVVLELSADTGWSFRVTLDPTRKDTAVQWWQHDPLAALTLHAVRRLARGNLTVADVLPLALAYYEEHPAGGSLHVVLDDHNVEDAFVLGCITDAQARGDTAGATLGQMLLLLTEDEREQVADAV